MAEDTPNGISYFLMLDEERIEDLRELRPWKNILMSNFEKKVWLTGFDFHQIESVEVKSIPFKELFYLKENQIYPYGSLLPNGSLPDLNFKPIQEVLRLRQPSFNENYFGLKQVVQLKLIPTEDENITVGVLIDMELLNQYLEEAPVVRTESLRYSIVNGKDAFVMGTPLLPIKGKGYWRMKDSFLPLGMTFNLPILHSTLNDKLNNSKKSLLIWNEDGSYFIIEKDDLENLSKGSLIRTNRLLNHSAEQ